MSKNLFDSIYGNEPIKIYLRACLEEVRLPQTLLFEGMEGIGKGLFAREVAARLLECPLSRIEKQNHPDFHVVRPEGKSGLHPIDELRKCIDQVYEAPFEAKRKVFLIHDAERMQAPSANALLKTLEEPPLDTTIILLTSQPREFLPTILSRCIQLHFHPLPTESVIQILKEKGFDSNFAAQAHGSAEAATLLATDPSFLEMQTLLLDLLTKPVFYPNLAEGLEKIEQILEPVKEESPVAYYRRVDLLFATVLMWARDQMLRQIGGVEPFFKDLPSSPPPKSLARFEEALQESRLAFQRNIKLSVCLEQCLLIKR